MKIAPQAAGLAGKSRLGMLLALSRCINAPDGRLISCPLTPSGDFFQYRRRPLQPEVCTIASVSILAMSFEALSPARSLRGIPRRLLERASRARSPRLDSEFCRRSPAAVKHFRQFAIRRFFARERIFDRIAEKVIGFGFCASFHSFDLCNSM